MTTLTIRLDDKLDSDLRELAARTGTGKSEFVREAIRRQIAITRLADLRRHVAPFAEAHGWLTDEDVFEDVS
ncbi:MAG: ribbon-helix-helix domain-containing protein [Gammaproteobacteria bacterium]|nr:ribbon-helix-helix domain-containing protein [Gammaproteobacteria bacterium]